jgi:hypothetical protein
MYNLIKRLFHVRTTLYFDVFGNTKLAFTRREDAAGQCWNFTLAEVPQAPALSTSYNIATAIAVPFGVSGLTGAIAWVWRIRQDVRT